MQELKQAGGVEAGFEAEAMEDYCSLGLAYFALLSLLNYSITSSRTIRPREAAATLDGPSHFSLVGIRGIHE